MVSFDPVSTAIFDLSLLKEGPSVMGSQNLSPVELEVTREIL